MTTPLPRIELQPVVNDECRHESDDAKSAMSEGTDHTVCFLGKRFKVATLISAAALVVTLLVGGVTFVRTWGLNEGRIATLEDKASTAHGVQEQVRSKLGGLEKQQAATQSTVDAIQKQQSEDRRHFDQRLDRMYEAITRQH